MKNKKLHYPSKVTLNLAMREKSPFRPSRLLPPLLLLIIAAALFGKFAVADRLSQVGAAQQALIQLEQRRDELVQATQGYEELLEEYDRYSIHWMSDDEKALVLPSDMLDLMEQELMPYSQVQSASFTGNTLSLQLGGITLEDTSKIVQRLYQLPQVVNVSVYTASSKTETARNASVSMVITMTNTQEGGDGK